MKRLFLIPLGFCLGACWLAGACRAELAPTALRCEYLIEPRGVETPAPRLSWVVESSLRDQRQAAYHILVASSPAQLKAGVGDLWDNGRVRSDQSVQVDYRGAPLRTRQCAFWQVRVWNQRDEASPWSAAGSWTMGLLSPADWQGHWIAEAAEGAPGTPPGGGYEAQPATWLRRHFLVAGEVRRAWLYVSALGVYELYLNGKKVGDRILAPEWTDYHRRVQYQTYEVSDGLRRGDNVIGAVLGDGWYAGRLGMSDSLVKKLRGVYGRKPWLRAQLEIELNDGRRLTLATDGEWSSTREGPIRSSDLLDGEVYDARREQPGWLSPEFVPVGWRSVAVKPDEGPALVSQPNEPIRVIAELPALGLTEPRPGVYVFDFGQNLVGRCRLRARGTAGSTVTLRHAEMIQEDGVIYTANLRGAPQVDRYTFSGRGLEVYEPAFTQHGFRYVEVTGLRERPELSALVARVFNSSAREVGQFECSDPRLNQLWRNILWTQRANLMSVPTDCPQRDERLGWMGDIQAFAQTAIFNMDLAAFFTKWVRDIRDAQADDGRYPDFAPHPYGRNEQFSGVPAWGDAGVIVPWRVYVNYADSRMLSEHLESAKRWIEYIRRRNPDLIWRQGRHNDYNDWLNGDTLRQAEWPTKGGMVPQEVFATAFFAHSTELVAKMARALGRGAEAQQYEALRDEIRAAFNRAFVSADTRIRGDTQAGYALALNFDLLSAAQRPLAVKHLVEAIARYQQHISTGIQTTHRLMLELPRWGQTDLAWQLLTNGTFPSWGYMIDNGATTIWERWDGYVKGRGFQDPGMNSFNHWALGSVGEWLYRHIVGLQPDEQRPGYKHFTVAPRPGGGVTWARGAFEAVHGRINVDWRLGRDGFGLRVTVPANTTATVEMPAREAASVRESGLPASRAPGVHSVRVEAGRARLEVGSGAYEFWAPTRGESSGP